MVVLFEWILLLEVGYDKLRRPGRRQAVHTAPFRSICGQAKYLPLVPVGKLLAPFSVDVGAKQRATCSVGKGVGAGGGGAGSVGSDRGRGDPSLVLAALFGRRFVQKEFRQTPAANRAHAHGTRSKGLRLVYSLTLPSL